MSGSQPLPPAVNEFLANKLQDLSFAFVVANALASDMPICYASCAFYELTGYCKEEVVGRNCRFLQGPGTERRMVMEMRDAIREDRPCQVCVLNYKKNGEPFWNQLYLSPIFDGQGHATHYVGVLTNVSSIVASQEQRQQQVASTTPAPIANAEGAWVEASAGTVAQDASASSTEQEESVGPLITEEGPAAEVVQLEAQEASLVQHMIEQEHCSSSSQLPCSLLQPLMRVQQSFVLSDPNLPDNPIVHVSDRFLAMTGYPREEVVGRNCRFLQGPGTDAADVARLREAIMAVPPRAITTILLNYRKDGTPFWNALHVSPVRDADGNVMFHIGVQLDVSECGEAGGEQAGALAGADQGGATEAAAAGRPARLKLAHKCAHMSATGAVRVAVRSLSGHQGGLRRSLDNQGLPQRGCSRTLSGSGGSFDFGQLARGSGAGSFDLGRRVAASFDFGARRYSSSGSMGAGLGGSGGGSGRHGMGGGSTAQEGGVGGRGAVV